MDFAAILKWFGLNLQQPATWWQLAVTLVIIVIVAVLDRMVSGRLTQRASNITRSYQKISLKTLRRLFAPLLAMLLFLTAREILEKNEFSYGLLDIGVSLSIALAIIRTFVYLLRKTFPVTPALKAWENMFVIVVWLMVALQIVGWLPAIIAEMDKIAIHFGDTKVSLLGVVKTVLSVSFFVLLALWIAALIERRLTKAKHLANYLQIGIAKTIRVIIIIVAFLVALEVIGVDLTTLTVLGGALGVGIGFGLQRIASNFISGFILLFDRSIRPNDVISIGDSYGWVKELRARYVVIQDRDGVETLIPNENLITSQVINWSYTDKNVRVKIPVQISYQNDPELAMALLLEAAKENVRVLDQPAAAARLMAFGNDGINLELRLWINDPVNGINNVRSEVNLAIWKKFRANGISIPYPQRDVHLITSTTAQGQ